MKKREEEMSTAKKKRVSFRLTDGRVSRTGLSEVFNILAPYPLAIEPGRVLTFKTGVACDRPVHVFEARGVKSRGVRLLATLGPTFDMEEQVVIELENKTGETQRFELGEVVARFFVVDNSDLEVV